ncbi:MAG: MFS transporter [Bifidobacteriaceae bacterium]|nr:MFS transporter [Bifidobacteriaceae bacterium]
MKDTFASLAVRNYRVWYLGALFSNVGTWGQRVAQDWIVLTVFTNDDGWWVGVVTALQFGPSLLLSPVGGLMADRWDRRRVLMCTQVAQAALAFTFGGLLLAGQMNLGLICLFAAIGGCVTGFDAPFFQTFVGQLVGPRLLANAVGLNSANFNAARMIGPAVAGLALARWAAGWVFLFNGLSFVTTFTALALLRVQELNPMPAAVKARGQIREGLAFVKHRSDLVVILTVMGVVGCLGLNAQLTMGVMARGAFDKGAGEYGLLGSLFAVGALVGSLLAARRARPRVRLVVGSALAFGVVSGISALSPWYWFYAVSGIAVGAATLTLITAANSAIQLSVAPEMRGRVVALYMMVFVGSTPIGSPLVGWIANVWGPRWAIGVGAIASLLVALVAMIWVRTHWHVHVQMTQWLPPHMAITNPAAGETSAAPDAAPGGSDRS